VLQLPKKKKKEETALVVVSLSRHEAIFCRARRLETRRSISSLFFTFSARREAVTLQNATVNIRKKRVAGCALFLYKETGENECMTGVNLMASHVLAE